MGEGSGARWGMKDAMLERRGARGGFSHCATSMDDWSQPGAMPGALSPGRLQIADCRLRAFAAANPVCGASVAPKGNVYGSKTARARLPKRPDTHPRPQTQTPGNAQKHTKMGVAGTVDGELHCVAGTGTGNRYR